MKLLSFSFCIFAFAVQLSVVVSQQDNQDFCTGTQKQICGPVQNPGQRNTMSKDDCTKNTRCCFNETDFSALRCFLALPRTPDVTKIEKLVGARAKSLTLPSKPAATQVEKFKEETGKFNKSTTKENTGVRAKARLININQQSSLALLGLTLDFPACPASPPICQRVQCNSRDPTAEVNPVNCLSDPTCCFDRDLYLYKAIFGPGYLGGAPVCYYGPTSFRYRQLASTIVPWNPFFSSAIVQVYEDVLDTAITFDNQILCRISVLGADTIFGGPQCGWKGITKLQCSLKGCCYSDSKKLCVYPSSNFNLGSNEFHPELEAQSQDETVCTGTRFPPTFSSSVFRRLPCRSIDSSSDSRSLLTTCPAGLNPLLSFGSILSQPQLNAPCCVDYLGLIPQLSDFSSSSLLSNTNLFSDPVFLATLLRTYGSNLGSFGSNGLLGFSGISGLSGLSGFYCPFFYFSIPGFPDLSSSLTDCCKISPCYIRKNRYVPPIRWGLWSNWGPCNAPCGGVGQRQRSRDCSDGSTQQPSNQCSGERTQRESCQSIGPCWGPWSAWGTCFGSPCSNTGSQSRTRQCNGQFNSCSGSSSETLSCIPSCIYQWTQWSQIQNCNAACGSFGQGIRSRRCTNQLGQISNSCSGSSTQTQRCSGAPCPGQWTQWSPIQGCNAACGSFGQGTRSRRCTNQLGQTSNSCPGSSTQTQRCSGAPCPGQWTQWSAWEGCTQACGGTNTRRRLCRSNGQISNSCVVDSSGLGGTQVLSCNDCAQWTGWSSYGECDALCGRSGKRQSTRECRNNNRQAANTCSGSATRTIDCQGRPCYSYGQWNSWTPCQSSCTYTRTRSCRNANNAVVRSSNCGRTTRSSENKPCTGGTCLQSPSNSWVSWGNWQSWSYCSVNCGSGRQFRERSCLYLGKPDSRMPGTICDCFFKVTNGYRDEQSCNEPCSYSWDSWVNGDCENGRRIRTRRCVDSSGREVAANLCTGSSRETIADSTCQTQGRCQGKPPLFEYDYCDCNLNKHTKLGCCDSACQLDRRVTWTIGPCSNELRTQFC